MLPPIARRVGPLVAACLILAACGRISVSAPAPTPADFQGIAAEIVRRDIRIEHVVSGDAGCDDPELARTAIALDVAGLGIEEPTRIRLYIFRNRASYDRLHSTVDTCARSFITDPANYESIATSPFVLVGEGPWPAAFQAALTDALTTAAGTGN